MSAMPLHKNKCIRIKWSSTEAEIAQTKRGFYYKGGFPGVIGNHKGVYWNGIQQFLSKVEDYGGGGEWQI